MRVWDLESGVAVGKPLRCDRLCVMALTMGERADRAVIISGGGDGTVRVWDLESGVAVGKPLRGHDGSVSALALGERAGRAVIISGGDDGTVRTWDLENLRPEKVINVEAEVYAIALTDDSRSVVVGTTKGLMLLDWNSR